MSGSFHDHFSGHAAEYAAHRPGYPEPLFDALAGLVDRRRLAWDCAGGSGQAVRGLASRFERIVATDGSIAQLARARTSPNVSRWVALAERSGLRTRCIDLVTVAQALHWFDRPAFYREVRRVVRPGGAIVVWCYSLTRVTPDVDREVDRFYREVVGPYWPPERTWVEDAYRTIPFEFDEEPFPGHAIEARWSLDELLGYLGTWSATRRYMADRGGDPRVPLAPRLRERWPQPDGGPTPVRWPLGGRVGRIPGSGSA